MNHTFRGRTWSDNPEPEKVRQDAYAIERVSLRVAKGRTTGRYEAHTRATSLMPRLNFIGRTKLNILAIKIGGTELEGRAVSALQLYLRAGQGLQSFRRARFYPLRRDDLVALLALVGIKYHSYVAQSAGEIPAGRSHPHGA